MTSTTADSLGADGSLFEALFRVRAPEGPLLASLKALGVDPVSLEPKYRAQVWAQAVSLYREHLFPNHLGPEGHRRLGYELARGFAKTVPGMLLHATLPLLNPQQLLRRWPRFVRMGRTDVTITVTETGSRSADIFSIDPVDIHPEVNLGLFDFAFERMGETPRFVVVPRGEGEVLVHCSW